MSESIMTVSSRFSIRLKHHLMLLIGIGVLLTAFIQLIPGDDLKYLWSMGTGYVSIILLGITLLIGPINVYTKKVNPISTDLRRDVGIWCGVIGLAHVVVGIQVHMGNILLYFFKSVEGGKAFELRGDLFGAANYIGLAGTILLMILLLLSNDLSLRLLKPRRWKMIQRWNYFLFVAVLAHGVMYQIIEKRMLPIIVVFAIIMLLPTIGQLFGFTIKKQERQ